jgi:hypothetical protein
MVRVWVMALSTAGLVGCANTVAYNQRYADVETSLRGKDFEETVKKLGVPARAHTVGNTSFASYGGNVCVDGACRIVLVCALELQGNIKSKKIESAKIGYQILGLNPGPARDRYMAIGRSACNDKIAERL